MLIRKSLHRRSLVFCLATLLTCLAGCSGSSGDEQSDQDNPNSYLWIEGSPFAPAASVGPNCSGTQFESSGQQNFNLSPVRVSGTLTLNGSEFPESSGGPFGSSLGSITLEETSGRATTTVPITSQDGVATFQAEVRPGSYDIHYRSPDGGCNDDTLPCLGGEIRSSVGLQEERQLELNVSTARITGVITLGNERMPDSNFDRGALRVSPSEGNAVDLNVGGTGVADYELNVVTGTYDFSWQPGQQQCQTNPAGPIPCTPSPIEQDVSIQQQQTRSFNLNPVTVQGGVSVNGESLPDSSGTFGRLAFESSDGGAATTRAFTSDDATYELTVHAGDYDIYWAPPQDRCETDPTPGVPCVGGRLESDVSLNSDGNLDVDVPMAEISGAVSLGAGERPNTDQPWGFIGFLSRDIRFNDIPGAAEAAISGSVNSEQRGYEVALIPGNYDVAWFPPERRFCLSAQNIPCMTGPLERDVRIRSSGSLDLEVPSAHVTGEVTVGGEALSNTNGSRGQLEFVHEVGTSILTDGLGSNGRATYDVTVIPGEYDILWRPNDQTCGQETSPSLPCNSGIIRRDLPINSSGSVTTDISVVELSGLVTLNEGSFPNVSQNRGTLFFRNELGRHEVDDLGTSGTAPYEASVLADDYVVVFEGNPALCTSSEPIPCGTQVLDGC